MILDNPGRSDLITKDFVRERWQWQGQIWGCDGGRGWFLCFEDGRSGHEAKNACGL